MDPIRLCLLLSKIGFSIEEPSSAIEFFNTFLLPRYKFGDESSICLEMDVLLVKMRLGGHFDEFKNVLQETYGKIISNSLKEPVVFSKFYKASAEYRKVKSSSV